MAMQVQPTLVSADVSKATLDIARSDSQNVEVIDNDRKAILAWMKKLAGPIELIVEATNVYHLALVDAVQAAGHTVYVVDGYRLSKYRESIGRRAKTDRSDAQLLLRYLKNERDDLRPWSPPPKGYTQLQRLIHRRAVLAQTGTKLRQSLAGLPELKRSSATLLRELAKMISTIDKRIRKTLATLGWDTCASHCQGVEGIGPATSAALTMIYHRGQFASADAFIAFMGMDVRIRDSGTSRGRRKLTKRGDPELRRLLYMAAMAASRSERWTPFYERARARGLTRIQALVALARKLARIAYALLRDNVKYDPDSFQKACIPT